MMFQINGSGVFFAGLVLVLAAGISAPNPTAAQSTGNVKCNKCVDTSDFAKNAISTSRLKPGAVKTTGLRDNAVTGAKIRNGSVAGSDLANGAVGQADLAPDAVTGAAILDGSVTGADIAAGAVGTAKLVPDAVTGAAIQDGAVTGADIAPGAVGTAKLANDAVTGAAIMDGTITAADLAPDAATVGPDDIFDRTLVVSPAGDGSNATANGAELLVAITFLGTVAPAPGAANPWLLKLEPGVYDVGTTQATLLPYVGLKGGGEATTLIRGGNFFGPIVRGADHSEIRFLTVEHTGNLNFALAIQSGSVSSRISHVTAETRNPIGTARAIELSGDAVASDITARAVNTSNRGHAAAVVMSGTTVLRDATVSADMQLDALGNNDFAAGVFAGSGSQPELVNVTATASGGATEKRGVDAQGAGTVVTIRHSALAVEGANSNTAVRFRDGATGTVAHTQMVGFVPASLTCVNLFDENLMPVGSC